MSLLSPIGRGVEEVRRKVGMPSRKPAWAMISILVAGLCLAACVATPARIEGLAREDFPPDLEFPIIAGGPSEAADQLCDWARANQVAFSADEIERVRLESVHERREFEYAKAGLLHEFTNLGANLQTLIMEVGPDELFLPRSTTPVDPYKAVIDRRALWSFTRRPMQDCAVGEGVGLVAINDQCIFVEDVSESPLEGTVAADYRIFHFHAIVFPGRRQALAITVLSLYRADVLVGRSIWAHAYAGPMDLGHVNRSCEPEVAPWRFESVQEQ